MKECVMCGEEFEIVNWQHKYCSDKCRNEAKNQDYSLGGKWNKQKSAYAKRYSKKFSSLKNERAQLRREVAEGFQMTFRRMTNPSTWEPWFYDLIQSDDAGLHMDGDRIWQDHWIVRYETGDIAVLSDEIVNILFEVGEENAS